MIATLAALWIIAGTILLAIWHAALTESATMNELFDITPTLSPRIRWMDKHGIWCRMIEAEPEKWQATAAGFTCTGTTADDAIVAIAKKLNIKLWNEEAR